MNEAELRAVLEDAGLSPYQARTYVTLLDLGDGAATDVAEESGVPDPRIYDVLRDLEQEGYVETYEGDTLRARIHDFGALQEALANRATRLSEAVEEVERRWEQPSMEQSMVSSVTRFETVLEAATDAIGAAENYVQVATNPEHYRRLRPALRTATEHGASVHLSVSTDGDGESLPAAEDVAPVCTEARHRRFPSPFLAVVDRATVCFAPHAGSANEYGLIVQDRTHAYVFYWFFLTTQWDIWEAFYAPSEDGTGSEYFDIRYCVRDVGPMVEAGETVRLRVEGIDTETGEALTVEGVVRDVVVDPRCAVTASRPVVAYGGRVAVVLETDSGPVEVGGWGALVEDVEAHRLRVLSPA